MKRVIRASEDTKTFRIYFKDGNQKLIEAPNIYIAVQYVCFELNFSAGDIYKIEEIEQ